MLRPLLVAATTAAASAGSPWGPIPAQQAAAIVSQMTLDQKVSLLHGYGSSVGQGNYVGVTTGIPALGIPQINLEDGPQGVADEVQNVTSWPSALTMAMTWDRQAAFLYGQAMGLEQRTKGTNVMLGPGVNLARVPWGGRNFEYMGEDPYLASQLVAPEVMGVQSNNISACVKHYMGNNQEYDRNSASSNIPNRAAKELYYQPYASAVDAGVGTAMCSYNRVNNTYACENNGTLGELFNVMNFSGWIMSDWGATHSTVASALAGLNQEMPGGDYFGSALSAAVTNGTVPESYVDDKATRILTVFYALNMMNDQPTGNLNVDARSQEHVDLARYLAESSAALLKNDGNLLPLKGANLTNVLVLGDAFTVHGYGSGGVYPGGYISTPYQGIYAYLNGAPPALRNASDCTIQNLTQVQQSTSTCLDAPSLDFCQAVCLSDASCAGFSYQQGSQCNGWSTPGGACWPLTTGPSNGNQKSGWTTGYCGPAPSGNARVNVVAYSGDNTTAIAAMAAAADVVIVSLATACSEGEDRPNLDLPSWQNAMLTAAAAANPNTVAVIRAPGPVLMPWLSTVPAVLYQLMPGQEAGNALARLLFGAANPSGKLPVSFPASMDDTWLGSPVNPAQYPGTDRGNGWLEADYSEELLIGYRWYDAQSTTPLFPFGHGLSYTSFEYSALSATSTLSVSSGGTANVSFSLTNSGSYSGSEVAQVYISYPAAADEPPKLLKGFEKVRLDPGQTAPLAFTLAAADLSIWSVASQAWTLIAGQYTVLVGSSSRDIRVTGTFTVGN